MLSMAIPRFRQTTLVAVFCLAVLTGVWWGSTYRFDGLSLAASTVPFGLWLLKKQGVWAMLLLAVAGAGLGSWRGSVLANQLENYHAAYGRTVILSGKAADDGVYGSHSQLAFSMTDVRLDGRPLPGRVGVSGFGENAVYRGDTVTVRGKLRQGSGSYQAWVSYARLTVTSHGTSVTDAWRRRFTASMQSVLAEPLGSFGMGLLIGQKSTLPKDISQDLLMVGLVHIIAVSGYNLTILLRAAWRLSGSRSKYQTAAISLGLITVFMLFTGYSASIVRAALVSVLSLAAWYQGRRFRPTVLLLIAAAVTAAANPLYLMGDMGWYLSFLAFYGVLVLAPTIAERAVPERLRRSLLLNVALESLCAEIMTLPLVLHVFGQLSLVSLAANVFVATLVPVAMLFSMVAGLAGMFAAPLAGWLAWPASLLLSYMLDVAHLLAGVPHSFLQHISLSTGGMLSLYAAVALATSGLAYNLKKKRATMNNIAAYTLSQRPSYAYAQPRLSDD